MKKIAYILKIFIHVSLISENNKFQRGPSHKFALKNDFFSREKTFAFCCFEICKGINFREKVQKTRKKFLPVKVLVFWNFIISFFLFSRSPITYMWCTKKHEINTRVHEITLLVYHHTKRHEIEANLQRNYNEMKHVLIEWIEFNR